MYYNNMYDCDHVRLQWKAITSKHSYQNRKNKILIQCNYVFIKKLSDRANGGSYNYPNVEAMMNVNDILKFYIYSVV